MEFLSRSAGGDGPLVAFGGSDGIIRVLSMITWKVGGLSSCWSIIFSTSVSFICDNTSFLQLVRRYTGGHKGSISCLMTFMASSGEVKL